MDDRIRRFNQAALDGNINAFYDTIGEDVNLLEPIDESPFVDTPLHKSASAGHIPFSIEMMKLRPSYISKPNPNGHTPIYLALQNGHSELCKGKLL